MIFPITKNGWHLTKIVRLIHAVIPFDISHYLLPLVKSQIMGIIGRFSNYFTKVAE